MAKTRKAHDDLFDGTTMTFGEHLEELRRSLFRGIIGIVIGCAIGFWIANEVVRFFQSPLERAMQRYYLDKALADFGSDPDQVPIEVRKMIIDEGLIPDRVNIETGSISDSLSLTYPEQFGKLNLSPYWYTLGDFGHEKSEFTPGQLAKQLAERLATEGKSEKKSPVSRIWMLLSADERTTVESLAAANGALSEVQMARLAAVLNSVAGNRKLYDALEFREITGPDVDTVSSLQNTIMRWFNREAAPSKNTVDDLRTELKKQYNAEKARRLNKLLIGRVFPEQLRKARLNLMTFLTWKPVKVRFQVLNAQEAFMIWMKAGLVTGLVIASPWLFYQIWNFVAAGLYPHEKNYVYLYLPISILLFVGGASLAFVFVFDPVLDFLFMFNKGMNADFDPRIGEWLGFVLILPVGFGVSFQLPLVMLFVNRIGLVTTETYIAQWRVAILTIFVVAMVLTPADPVSMLLMALPLCGLFVVGIAMCKYMPQGRNPFNEAYEP
jgi:sec-independent protein translocase protein TatC